MAIWIEQLDGAHYCSNCGHDVTYTFDGTEVCGVACPFCGEKMVEEENNYADTSNNY